MRNGVGDGASNPAMDRRHFLLAVASVPFVLGLATDAQALPAVGGARPGGTVVDADGNAFDTRAVNGKPMLLVYEDKGSATQNKELKDDLGKLASGEKYRTKVALIPIADVEGYDYWPASAFVKSSIRSESKKINSKIYIDWDGSFRKASGFTQGKSTIVLVGADGKVRYAYEGTLPKDERDKLIAALKKEVGDN